MIVLVVVLAVVVAGVALGAGRLTHIWTTSLGDLIKVIVHEETADLRRQMYPNGGSSLADKINTIRDDVVLIRSDLVDVRTRLEAIHPTGEIPVTSADLSAEAG